MCLGFGLLDRLLAAGSFARRALFLFRCGLFLLGHGFGRLALGRALAFARPLARFLLLMQVEQRVAVGGGDERRQRSRGGRDQVQPEVLDEFPVVPHRAPRHQRAVREPEGVVEGVRDSDDVGNVVGAKIGELPRRRGALDRSVVQMREDDVLVGAEAQLRAFRDELVAGREHGVRVLAVAPGRGEPLRVRVRRHVGHRLEDLAVVVRAEAAPAAPLLGDG